MPRGPRTLRPVENQPTTHGERARWRTWRGCLRGQRGRAPPHAVDRGSSSPTPRQVGGCGFETTYQKLPNCVLRGPRASRPVENQPIAHGARAHCRTWRGCLCSQRKARSIPRRWPKAHFNATSPGRRLRLQGFMAIAPNPVPRSPRALCPVENRPTAQRERARWWTRRGCLRGQRGARCTPRRWPRLFFTDTASDRWLRLRNDVSKAYEFRAALPARASPCGELVDRPRSTRALADLAWLSLQPTRSALHPTPLAESPLQRNFARSAAAALRLRDYRFRILCRAAHVRFAPWRISRTPTEHVRAGGLVVVVFAANAGRATPHNVGRGSFSPTQKTGQRLRLQNVVIRAFEFRAARPARASSR